MLMSLVNFPVFVVYVSFSSAQIAGFSPPDGTLNSIETTCVDPSATGYGTFQSHNQKVVANARGIFMTHIRTRNEPYTAQQWRLSWSRDGGKTFETLYEATHATNPPILETDEAGNIYLIRPDFVDTHAYLYRFPAEKDYAEPVVTRIPHGAAGKYSMVLDRLRKQIYYFAHNTSFHRIALDGAIKSSGNLLKDGPSAMLQYPLLFLDASGTLHAAWTTQKKGVYLYWDIHYLQSPDGGVSWRTMNGSPVEPPVVADEHGPADRITLDDEFDAHTWLSSFMVHGGKAHFLYLAQMQAPRQHYVRYDLASASRERDVQPQFKGEALQIRSLDGFFATRSAEPDATIYVVARDADSPRLVCLASDDHGSTWRDHAVSAPFINPYSIGGCREVTPDGWIIGSFTEQVASTLDSGGGSKVHFFRIRADRPRAQNGL
jgi:hypothetical protein